MQEFQELGELIESRWRAQNYNDDRFPEIAGEALTECDLTGKVDPWDIIRWVHSTPNLPRQQDPRGKFGNPPITLFVGPRFYVDVYFWLDGTTSIHQHAFSGAFQVLLGSSVHSRFRFEQEQEINPYFLIGNLSLKSVSLLAKGDTRQILPGHEFIHSLFHLDRPSATITVRSNHSPSDAIQYSYLKPFIAYDPFFEEDSLVKKIQTVSLLLSMKHPEADRFIEALIHDADFQTTFSILKTSFEFLGNNQLEDLFQIKKSANRFQSLIDTARLRHGKLVDRLPEVFEEQLRQKDIVQRRGAIEGDKHRFFLALLLNVPDRAGVLELIKNRFPDADPVELALSWIKELAAIRIFGSHEPNVLGLEGFDAGQLVMFEGLLNGLEDEQIILLTNQKTSLPKSTIVEALALIRALPLFKSIFKK